MREFLVKGTESNRTFVTIDREEGTDYVVTVRKITDYGVKEQQERLSRDLLEICLRTGYLTEIDTPRAAAKIA